MLYPVAIEPGDEQHAFGVIVPDIPGCYSAGDTFDEAMTNVKEAIEGHLEILAEDGELPPEANPTGSYINQEEYQGFMWGLVDINTEPYLGKSEKINVTLPRLLLAKIQKVIDSNPAYKNRSQLIQLSVLHELNRLQEL